MKLIGYKSNTHNNVIHFTNQEHVNYQPKFLFLNENFAWVPSVSAMALWKETFLSRFCFSSNFWNKSVTLWIFSRDRRPREGQWHCPCSMYFGFLNRRNPSFDMEALFWKYVVENQRSMPLTQPRSKQDSWICWCRWRGNKLSFYYMKAPW